jgi:hypothetical protein
MKAERVPPRTGLAVGVADVPIEAAELHGAHAPEGK